MKQTKHSLVVSAVSLLLSAAMLLGTTFAWFTDGVVNKNNAIQAGTLLMDAYVYDLSTDGTGQSFQIKDVNGGDPFVFSATGRNLKENSAPIISEQNWEPGVSSAKLLTIQNSGTLAQKIKLQFQTSGGLTDALWFDFVQVNENGEVTGNFQKRSMNTLSTFAQNLELPLVNTGDAVTFILVYGMYEDAANEYMNETFSADVTILGAQYSFETDGFGSSSYDSDAEYDVIDVSNASDLQAAAQAGKNVRLTQNIATTDEIVFSDDAKLYLNGQTLTVNGGKNAVKAGEGKTLTVYGSGTVNGALYANKNATLIVNGGSDFKVESNGNNAVYGGTGATIELNGGTYMLSEQKGNTIELVSMAGVKASLHMKDATVNVGTNSYMNSVGIHSNAPENVLENVTVNAKFSRALYFNSESSHVVIKGGTFTTDKISGAPNPTIQYSGTLEISDAVINRVGTGILYRKTWPKPTEIVGLTMENVTFHQADPSAAAYQDTDYNR